MKILFTIIKRVWLQFSIVLENNFSSVKSLSNTYNYEKL